MRIKGVEQQTSIPNSVYAKKRNILERVDFTIKMIFLVESRPMEDIGNNGYLIKYLKVMRLHHCVEII